jgi:hypothetical protein
VLLPDRCAAESPLELTDSESTSPDIADCITTLSEVEGILEGKTMVNVLSSLAGEAR